MRFAVYALLLANLLYLGWAEWIDVPGPPPRSSIAALPHLTLVSELPPAKRAALSSKASLQTPAPQCVSIGPFDDPAVAGKAIALLKTKSFAPQQRAAESPAIRRFWVYLDGFTSDAAEMRVLHRLERAGIDDAEAMPAAAGGRKVSLGLFSDQARAARRERAVRAMGFKPAMAERRLPGTVYWLDLALPNGTAVPLKDVSGLEPGGSGSAISVQPCPSASSPAAPAPQAGSPGAAPAASPHGRKAAQAAALPICKPGGGGPVPCVVEKAPSQSSVL